MLLVLVQIKPGSEILVVTNGLTTIYCHRSSATVVEERSADAEPSVTHATPQTPPTAQLAWEMEDAETPLAADNLHQQPQPQPSSPLQLKKKKARPTVPFAGASAFNVSYIGMLAML